MSMVTRAAVVLVSGSLVVSGCAKSTMMPIRALADDPKPYTSVSVSVETKVAEDVGKEISELQGEIVSKTREMKRFQEVTLAGSTPPTEGLWVKANVIGVRKVGGGMRFLIGAFAGRASLVTDVEFVDAATGQSLGSYSFKEETGSSGMAGTTTDSVRKTAKAIAKFLADHFATPPPATATR